MFHSMLAIFWTAFLDITFWQDKEFSSCPKPSNQLLFRVYWSSFPEINFGVTYI